VSDVPTVLDVGAELTDVDGVDDGTLGAAADVAVALLDPLGDIHASADYRAHLARVLTVRVLRAAYDDARARLLGGRDEVRP
jgi:carbon-monoxide dehydrogenase medium subunit